ncbi:hypothetical protein OSI84_20420, partial [Mycobacterium ulcerans]
PPAPAAAGFGFPFVVGGGPGIGYGEGMSASAAASARRKAPEPDSAALAAAAAVREEARRRRRKRKTERGYGEEFMDVEVDPDWGGPLDDEPVASTQGAGRLGFAGTVHSESAATAAGLTTLVADEFGGGPKMPMLPGTWDTDSDAPSD